MAPLEALAYDDSEEAEPSVPPSPARMLSLEVLRYRFMDLGIVLFENGNCVDFYRLAKRGPVHPLYAQLFRAMPVPTFHALENAFASGRITPRKLFEAFTKGEPPPEVLIFPDSSGIKA